MIQQVNLYQDILKKGQNKLTINPYWAVFAFVVISVFALSINLFMTLKETEQEVSKFQDQLTKEKARVAQFMSKIPKQEIDKQLNEDIVNWQKRLDELTQTVQQLSGGNIDLPAGFSVYFQALANQSIPEVWLSEIYISTQPRIINITGSTYKADQIPIFFQHLQKEPIFKGHHFAKLLMEASEKVPNQIDFTLSTTLQDSKLKKHDQ